MRSLAPALAALATALAPAASLASDAARPVKIVVHGGSVSAYRHGGFSQWIPAACKNVTVDSVAMPRLGAGELRKRFVTEVLRPGRVDTKAYEAWLVFLGGLNSIDRPELTNLEVAKTFKLAHDAGFRTMGLTVTPWGSERDGRWRGASGLEYFAYTQKTVDFVMGRLTPAEAFGERAASQASYLPGQLPDVGVDLWDSPLRHRDAPPREDKALESSVRASRWVGARLDAADPEAREAAIKSWVAKAAALPRWFLKPELVGSDPVHPGSEGHKEIARAICAKAPTSWGCDCSLYDKLRWDPGTNKPAPR